MLNQNVIKWMVEAREKGDTIRVRYGKVLFSGSSAAGKTSFFRLLMKESLDDQYKSTGLADPKRVITKVYLHSNENIEFKELDFETEISQLTSHLDTKISSTAPYETKDTMSIAANSELITEIESNMAVKSEIHLSSNSGIHHISKKSSEKIWDILTFVDTGGQPEYINMLPAVNSCVMITFVVHKMKGGVKTLNNPVTVIHSDKHGESYSLGYTNLDLIKTLMSFTNNNLLRKKPFLDDVCYRKGNLVSYLSFIGTHLDEVPENNVRKIDEVLITTVSDSGLIDVFTQLTSDYTHIVPVDNTTAGQTNEDKNANKIRKKVYDLLQDQDIYDVPYVWILLELEIRNVCKKRGCPFITYTEVLELCKKQQLSENEDFIKNGLKFHHLFGVLLYFDEVIGMQNIIITNHKWLFDKLTNIVVFPHRNSFSNTEVYYDFKLRGIFNETLLDHINLMEDFMISGIEFDTKKSFLNLLKHLNIIAPLKNSTKNFMPCLLSSCDLAENLERILQNYGTSCIATDDNSNLPAEPLLIQFTKHSSSNQSGSFPRGVYCCLVVRLFQDNPEWIPQWSTNTEKKIFNNLVTFFIEDRGYGYYITLVDRLFFLELHITHYGEKVCRSAIYHKIFSTVSETLLRVGKGLNFHDFSLNHGFLCHKCKKPEVHMAKLHKQNKEFLFCYSNQATKLTPAHKIWLKDFLGNTTTDYFGSDYKKGRLHLIDTTQGTYIACHLLCVYKHHKHTHVSIILVVGFMHLIIAKLCAF